MENKYFNLKYREKFNTQIYNGELITTDNGAFFKYFPNSILQISFLDIYKCPFLIFVFQNWKNT
jgi:hypothetical protein